MVFQVKMDLQDLWVQEGLLVREDDQDFQELQGPEVMMVLEEVMASQVPLVPLELQDSLVLLVLRVKSDLLGLLVQVVPQDKEENLDLKVMLVLKVLLALPGITAALVVKVKWVLLAFLELLGFWDPEVHQDHPGPMVHLDREVVQVSLVRTVPKESQGHVVNAVKLVLQELQDPRVKMAKMVLLENLAQMEFQELQEKGVHLDSEELPVLMAFQEKRVPLESVVVSAQQDQEELLENPAETVSLEVQESGVCLEAQEDQAMMESQDLQEVKEKVVDQVPQAHRVPEDSLVSWVSLVLKEMMVLLARMEKEVALEVQGLRVLLERMVKLDLRGPQDLLDQLVTKESPEPLVCQDHKACLEPTVLLEKMESLVNQVQKVKLARLDLQEARVMLVPLVNVGLPEEWDHQVLEVELVPQVLKEEKALQDPLAYLVMLVPLVCKGCQEKEEALEVLDQRVKRASQVVLVLMVPLEKMAPGVLLVPLVPLAQLVLLEIRVKVVLQDFLV